MTAPSDRTRKRTGERAKPTYIDGGKKRPRRRPLRTPEGYDEWVDLAERRIISVLHARVAANIRQLEVKISECGPANIRPEPHILTDALKNLAGRRLVRSIKPKGIERREETQFYTLASNTPRAAKDRVDQLLVPYRTHRMLTDTEEYCSRVLEGIVHESFAAASGYKFLGKGTKSSPLDGVYAFRAEKIGSEVKNVREWIYPTSGEVWVMVAKCLEIDAVPFLIARKTSFIARAILDQLGIMHFQVFRQVFSQRVAHLLPDIQHTDKLGYKDVLAVEIAANPHLVGYLKDTLPEQTAAYRAQWNRRRDVLHEFAVTRGLGNPEMKDRERFGHFDDLRRAVFPRVPEEIDDDDYPDREPEEIDDDDYPDREPEDWD